MTMRPLATPRLAAPLIGVAAIVVAAGLWWSPERTWPTLLVCTVYLLFVALGGALFLSTQHLSHAGWSRPLWRVAEAITSALPVAAVLMLSMAAGWPWLYPWAHGGAEPMGADKARYLSPIAVFVRSALVLGAWALLARALRRHERRVFYSALFVVVFAPSFLVASVDWIMSLSPHWASTIFVVYLFAGVMMSGLVVLTLIVLILQTRDVSSAHLHDLGTLIFAFSTFWAYIWLSQYLLIWYSNLPDEVTHYVRRTHGAWAWLFFLNPIVNWVVPFVVLLPWAAKHHPRTLAAICLLLLGGRWLDVYLLIAPEARIAPAIGPIEVLVPLGYAGLFVVCFSRALQGAPVAYADAPPHV